MFFHWLIGGSVVSTRCSETFHRKTALVSIFGIPVWYTSNSPRTIIQVARQLSTKFHSIYLDTGLGGPAHGVCVFSHLICLISSYDFLVKMLFILLTCDQYMHSANFIMMVYNNNSC